MSSSVIVNIIFEIGGVNTKAEWGINQANEAVGKSVREPYPLLTGRAQVGPHRREVVSSSEGWPLRVGKANSQDAVPTLRTTVASENQFTGPGLEARPPLAV